MLAKIIAIVSLDLMEVGAGQGWEPLVESIPGVIQTGVTLEKLMIYQISAKKMKIHVISSPLTWCYVQYHHHSAGQG